MTRRNLYVQKPVGRFLDTAFLDSAAAIADDDVAFSDRDHLASAELNRCIDAMHMHAIEQQCWDGYIEMTRRKLKALTQYRGSADVLWDAMTAHGRWLIVLDEGAGTCQLAHWECYAKVAEGRLKSAARSSRYREKCKAQSPDRYADAKAEKAKSARAKRKNAKTPSRDARTVTGKNDGDVTGDVQQMRANASDDVEQTASVMHSNANSCVTVTNAQYKNRELRINKEQRNSVLDREIPSAQVADAVTQPQATCDNLPQPIDDALSQVLEQAQAWQPPPKQVQDSFLVDEKKEAAKQPASRRACTKAVPHEPKQAGSEGSAGGDDIVAWVMQRAIEAKRARAELLASDPEARAALEESSKPARVVTPEKRAAKVVIRVKLPPRSPHIELPDDIDQEMTEPQLRRYCQQAHFWMGAASLNRPPNFEGQAKFSDHLREALAERITWREAEAIRGLHIDASKKDPTRPHWKNNLRFGLRVLTGTWRPEVGKVIGAPPGYNDELISIGKALSWQDACPQWLITALYRRDISPEAVRIAADSCVGWEGIAARFGVGSSSGGAQRQFTPPMAQRPAASGGMTQVGGILNAFQAAV